MQVGAEIGGVRVIQDIAYLTDVARDAESNSTTVEAPNGGQWR